MVRKKSSKPNDLESDSFNEELAVEIYSKKEFVPPAISELVSSKFTFRIYLLHLLAVD